MPVSAMPPPVPPADNWFEETLQDLGLTKAKQSMSGLDYSGKYRGREWKIHLSRRTRTKYSGSNVRRQVYIGHRLEIEARTSVGTRLTIACPTNGLQRWVAKFNAKFGATLIENNILAPPLQVWANEPQWAERFIRIPEFATLVGKLMEADRLTSGIGLKWWPERLSFSQRIFISKVNAENLKEWINAVSNLAELAEADPPSQKVELNRWEKFSLDNPMGAGCAILGILFAVLMLVSALFVGFLLLVSWLMTKGG